MNMQTQEDEVAPTSKAFKLWIKVKHDVQIGQIVANHKMCNIITGIWAKYSALNV